MNRMWSRVILVTLGAAILVAGVADAQNVVRSSWGQVKSIYRPDAPQSVQQVPAEQLSMRPTAENETTKITKPGATINRVTSWRVKPYKVDEFWRDPNNPSKYHVVMFFRITTNACRYPVGRLWQGYEHDWLNNWMLWVRYPSANTVEYMLFAEGWWWWGHRTWSAWNMSQQFELCF